MFAKFIYSLKITIQFHLFFFGLRQRTLSYFTYQEFEDSDQLDETILPSDWRISGHIVDDEINDILVQRLPEGAKLTAIMDCCHSGTGK